MASKTDILKRNGTYNNDKDAVLAEDFQKGIFFDPEDLVQVKYEMVRSVEKGEKTVQEAAHQYGLSRQSYYVIRKKIEEQGLGGLVPRKTGPKGSYKLKEEGMQFIDRYLSDHPNAKSSEVNKALYAKTGITVHNRTVDRYMSKKHLSSRKG
jgi:transposase